MATLVLSAAGAAFGSGIGGSVVGLSAMALGKAVGATLGSVIDQRLLGAGSAPVETGRVDRLRIMGSSEGAGLPRCYGRVRLAGQLIWSSRFSESVAREDVGGKGGRGGQSVRRYSYSISIAVALCEGQVYRIGRIWADGQPVAQSSLNWRLHPGTEDQLPDPLIAAIEGAEAAPAYRGTAYVVIEDLDLTPYGNRIPQFNFEVFRRPQVEGKGVAPAALDVRGVALVPGTGEYALATVPVTINRARGDSVVVNVNNDRGVPDVVASLEQMEAELPRCEAVSLVVSWFGDDLRIGQCPLYPAVEQNLQDGEPVRWNVAGVDRSGARVIQRLDGRPLFGGTPADTTVVQAIRHLKAAGKAVMFYPFILMDIIAGNGKEDPWAPEREQPAVPWRGRMTLSRAPGVPGSPDQSPAAAAEVAQFFGTAEPHHFTVQNGRVSYSGPAEWTYRRFILHYAALCAAAGGVDSFCIGTEMRSLTQIRDGAASYPAVRALRRLAADVREFLGPEVRIGYAADWSEYFGHHPQDGSGDVLFHLDELWADEAIDFIGIDNYMPLADWRDGKDHLDAGFGSIHNVDYLAANVAGGEGHDWYYPDAGARERQERHPIEDGAYGEPWVFRYKDLVNWWQRPHFNRIGGVRQAEPTAWQPRSKPIWFTEYGCPAVDKGANQPNVFHDPKSSESFLPYHSDGSRDDEIQHAYIRAMMAHWSDPEANPWSEIYGGRMVDLGRCFVWAWDARPWPDFPLRSDTWVDGPNYERGHWLNGRIGRPSLASIVADICERSGFRDADVAELRGLATGYLVSGIETARQSLQPLMLTHAIDVVAEEARLAFRSRDARAPVALDLERLVDGGAEGRLVQVRSAPFEAPSRVAFGFSQADRDYRAGTVDAIAADAAEPVTHEVALPVVLTPGEARAVAERWLHEARQAQDTIEFALPPSMLSLGAGDKICIRRRGIEESFRIDRVDEHAERRVTAVRIDEATAIRIPDEGPPPYEPVVAPGPVHVEFLDLPMLTGSEEPHAPHVAALRQPWAGPVAVYAANGDFDYRPAGVVERPAVMGRLLEPLQAATPGLWMRGRVKVQLDRGRLESRSIEDVLAGANAAAIRLGDGEPEVIQFADAHLVGPRTWEIGFLLRGQAGTDAFMPQEWPAEADFILLDGALVQVEMAPELRGTDRHYRIGPADRPYSDDSYVHRVHWATGAGLRPYRPVHLRAAWGGDGSLTVTWIRRGRVEADRWDGLDIPVGEESLMFHLRIIASGRTIRTADLSDTAFTYPHALQVADGLSRPFAVEVAQVSARFGAGPYQRIVIDE